MRHKVYTVTERTDEAASRDLAERFEHLGYSYQRGQFGGGVPGSKEVQEIVAWLSINSFWGNLVTGLMVSLIGKTLKSCYRWTKKYWKKSTTPVVNITIYGNRKNQLDSYSIKINKDYSMEDVKKLLKRAGQDLDDK